MHHVVDVTGLKKGQRQSYSRSTVIFYENDWVYPCATVHGKSGCLSGSMGCC